MRFSAGQTNPGDPWWTARRNTSFLNNLLEGFRSTWIRLRFLGLLDGTSHVMSGRISELINRDLVKG